MCISRSAKVLAWLGVLVVSVPCLAQNDPPAAPLITQPEVDGLILNPADVHMETGPFSDPDPGDDPLCTDGAIWTPDPAERVWVTECIGGVERVHSHLGDGVFENSHAGRDELLPETEYVLRVRHRDDSGQSNDWSPWADRLFQTGEASAIAPFDYAMLIWASLWGFVIWGVVPDHFTLAGGLIIAAGGIVLFRREGQKVSQIQP